jgi:hypothetical protein
VVKELMWRNMTQQKISKLGFSREENIELSISKLAYRRGH